MFNIANLQSSIFVVARRNCSLRKAQCHMRRARDFRDSNPHLAVPNAQDDEFHFKLSAIKGKIDSTLLKIILINNFSLTRY